MGRIRKPVQKGRKEQGVERRPNGRPPSKARIVQTRRWILPMRFGEALKVEERHAQGEEGAIQDLRQHTTGRGGKNS